MIIINMNDIVVTVVVSLPSNREVNLVIKYLLPEAQRLPRRFCERADAAVVECDLSVILYEEVIQLDDIRVLHPLESKDALEPCQESWRTFTPNWFEVPSMLITRFRPGGPSHPHDEPRCSEEAFVGLSFPLEAAWPMSECSRRLTRRWEMFQSLGNPISFKTLRQNPTCDLHTASTTQKHRYMLHRITS